MHACIYYVYKDLNLIKYFLTFFRLLLASCFLPDDIPFFLFILTLSIKFSLNLIFHSSILQHVSHSPEFSIQLFLHSIFPSILACLF